MKIIEGITKNGDAYIFDYTADKHEDIVHLVGPEIYKNEFSGNTYYFGYRFNDDISSSARSAFIKFLKGYSAPKVNDSDFIQFANRPMKALDKAVKLSEVDAVVYPVSSLNNVVRKLVSIVSNFMPHGIEYVSYELIKNAPNNVKFDYNAFAADRGGKDSQSYKDSLPYIKNMITKIHSLNYFSIARDVKSKYRKFISDYLVLNNDDDTHAIRELSSAHKILVVDDINTSGSTLNEILRIVRNFINTAEVFIYTLIGK